MIFKLKNIFKIILKIMDILKSYLENYPIASHHINSFNEWRYFGLEKTITSQFINTEKKNFEFKNVKFIPPSYSPLEAQIKSLPYNAQIKMDIVEYNKDVFNLQENIIHKDILISEIPMMVMPYDEGSNGIGGYFLVNNIERILVTNLRNIYNYPIITFSKTEAKKNRIQNHPIYYLKEPKVEKRKFEESEFEYLDYLNSIKNISESKNNDVIILQLTIRSISESSNHSCQTEIFLTKENQIYLSNSKFKGKINIGIIFKALGYLTENDFLWIVKDTKISNILFLSSFCCDSQLEALKLLSNELKFTQKTLENYSLESNAILNFLTFELFPHLGLTSNISIVSLYLANLITKMFKVLETNKDDNRDSLIFKRFDTSGNLIHVLFEQLFKKVVSNLTKYSSKKNNITMGIDPLFLIKRLMYCFNTGTWGALMSKYKILGVSQPASTSSSLSHISHLMRINNPIMSSESRNLSVREIHPSHLNYICTCESPEGQSIGVVLNFSIGTSVCTKIYPTIIMNLLAHLIKPIVKNLNYNHLLFINGRLIGYVENLNSFCNEYFFNRQIGKFDSGPNRGMTSLGIVDDNIFINCDEGRIVRLIKTNLFDNTITDLEKGIEHGHLQWLDPFEQEFGYFHYNEKNNLTPNTLFGVVASSIPFINHMPVPRADYASNMIKQSISQLGDENQYLKFCTTMYSGHFQHKPLVFTNISNIYNLNKHPIGSNILVAITPIYGFNQEDAIVLNKASVERGLFNYDMFKTHCLDEDSNLTDELKKICIPEEKLRVYNYNYCLLDKNTGIVKIGHYVYENDVIIGQVIKNSEIEKDNSLIIKKNEEGYVHDVVISEIDGIKKVKVVVISNFGVNVGDKFSSRFGQKGICGKIMPHYKLPFMEDGTVPDLFMNPLALPSRMTIPTILEALFGLYALEKQTSFEINNFESNLDVREKLKEENIDSSGCSIFRNPLNGKKMVKIFCGPMYHCLLAHLSKNKEYARSTGYFSKQSRQPPDGRSRNGGIRFGEMEKDAIIGLGMQHVLNDRFFDNSDKFFIYICENCNNEAINDNICFCGKPNIKKSKCCFTTLLLFSYLKSLGCFLKFNKKKNETKISNDDYIISDEEIEIDSDEDEDSDVDSDESNFDFLDNFE